MQGVAAAWQLVCSNTIPAGTRDWEHFVMQKIQLNIWHPAKYPSLVATAAGGETAEWRQAVTGGSGPACRPPNCSYFPFLGKSSWRPLVVRADQWRTGDLCARPPPAPHTAAHTTEAPLFCKILIPCGAGPGRAGAAGRRAGRAAPFLQTL